MESLHFSLTSADRTTHHHFDVVKDLFKPRTTMDAQPTLPCTSAAATAGKRPLGILGSLVSSPKCFVMQCRTARLGLEAMTSFSPDVMSVGAGSIGQQWRRTSSSENGRTPPCLLRLDSAGEFSTDYGCEAGGLDYTSAEEVHGLPTSTILDMFRPCLRNECEGRNFGGRCSSKVQGAGVGQECCSGKTNLREVEEVTGCNFDRAVKLLTEATKGEVPPAVQGCVKQRLNIVEGELSSKDLNHSVVDIKNRQSINISDLQVPIKNEFVGSSFTDLSATAEILALDNEMLILPEELSVDDLNTVESCRLAVLNLVTDETCDSIELDSGNFSLLPEISQAAGFFLPDPHLINDESATSISKRSVIQQSQNVSGENRIPLEVIRVEYSSLQDIKSVQIDGSFEPRCGNTSAWGSRTVGKNAQGLSSSCKGKYSDGKKSRERKRRASHSSDDDEGIAETVTDVGNFAEHKIASACTVKCWPSKELSKATQCSVPTSRSSFVIPKSSFICPLSLSDSSSESSDDDGDAFYRCPPGRVVHDAMPLAGIGSSSASASTSLVDDWSEDEGDVVTGPHQVLQECMVGAALRFFTCSLMLSNLTTPCVVGGRGKGEASLRGTRGRSPPSCRESLASGGNRGVAVDARDGLLSCDPKVELGGSPSTPRRVRRLSAVNETWCRHYESATTADTDADSKQPAYQPGAIRKCKKVWFSEAAATLVPVLNASIWAEEYSSARVGPWIQLGIDRCRFNRRIADIGAIVSPVLTREHRNRIHRERFIGAD